MRLWEKFASAVSVAVICGGLTYAYDREHLSHADLNPVLQQINQQYFDGGLSGVRVEWLRLDDKLGEAQKLGEHEYRIWIDRRENTSIADVRDTCGTRRATCLWIGTSQKSMGLCFGSACYKNFRSPMALPGGRRQCGIRKFSLKASSLFFQKAINLCG
jgi:hypothetical protein